MMHFILLLFGLLYNYHLIHTTVSSVIISRNIKQCQYNNTGGLEYSLLLTPIEEYKDEIYGGVWNSYPNEFGRCRINNNSTMSEIKATGLFTQTLPFVEYTDVNNKTGFHSVEFLQKSLFPEDGLSYGGSAIAKISKNGTQSVIATGGVAGKCLFEVRTNFYHRNCFVNPKMLHVLFLTYWLGLCVVLVLTIFIFSVNFRGIRFKYFVAYFLIKFSIPLPKSFTFCNEVNGLPTYSYSERFIMEIGSTPYMDNKKLDSFTNIEGEKFVLFDSSIYKIKNGRTCRIADGLSRTQMDNLRSYIWELVEMNNPCLTGLNKYYAHCMRFAEIVELMQYNSNLFVSKRERHGEITSLGESLEFDTIVGMFPENNKELLFRLYNHNLKFFETGLGNLNALILAIKNKTYYLNKPKEVNNSQWKLYTSDVSKLKAIYKEYSYFSDYRAPTKALKDVLDMKYVKADEVSLTLTVKKTDFSLPQQEDANKQVSKTLVTIQLSNKPEPLLLTYINDQDDNTKTSKSSDSENCGKELEKAREELRKLYYNAISLTETNLLIKSIEDKLKLLNVDIERNSGRMDAAELKSKKVELKSLKSKLRNKPMHQRALEEASTKKKENWPIVLEKSLLVFDLYRIHNKSKALENKEATSTKKPEENMTIVIKPSDILNGHPRVKRKTGKSKRKPLKQSSEIREDLNNLTLRIKDSKGNPHIKETMEKIKEGKYLQKANISVAGIKTWLTKKKFSPILPMLIMELKKRKVIKLSEGLNNRVIDLIKKLMEYFRGKDFDPNTPYEKLRKHCKGLISTTSRLASRRNKIKKKARMKEGLNAKEKNMVATDICNWYYGCGSQSSNALMHSILMESSSND